MAGTSRKIVGLYFMCMACLYLLTTAVNIRYRYDKDLEPHVGGADFAAPLFVFACLLSFPIIFSTFSNLKHAIHKNKLKLFLLFFFLPTLVGVVNAPLPEYSYIELARQCFVVFMTCVFLVMLRFTDIRWVYRTLALVTMAQALAVLIQLLGGEIPFMVSEGAHYLNESISRFAGIQGHPNILAGMMNIVAAFMLAGLFYESNLSRKFYIFFYILSSSLVLASFSRAGLLVLVCSSLFLISFGSGRNLFTKKYMAYIGLLVLGLLFFFIFGDKFAHRIFEGATSNITSRYTLNSIAFSAFSDNPLFGAGSNNFIYFSQDYDFGQLTKFWKAPVHNLYLLYASESGAVGFLSFCGMLVILFSNYRFYRRSGVGKSKILCAGAEAAFIGLLLGSFFGYFYKQDVVQPMLALLFAIGLCNFNYLGKRPIK